MLGFILYLIVGVLVTKWAARHTETGQLFLMDEDEPALAGFMFVMMVLFWPFAVLMGAGWLLFMGTYRLMLDDNFKLRDVFRKRP
jgi:hypothetical protein